MAEMIEISRGPGSPDVLVLRVGVDVDLETHGPLAALLMPLACAPGYERVVVDVTGRFVSACGMRMLAHALATAAAAGRSWTLAGLRAALLGPVRDEWFPGLPVHDTVDAALRAVRPAAPRRPRATAGTAAPGRSGPG